MSNSKLNKTEVLNNVDFKELSKTCRSQEDLSSLTKEFMKNMIENILKSELEEHLEESEKNSKNGYYKKTVRSDAGSLELDIPRDRACEYEPKLILKGKRTISGIDEKIISLYSRGMSLRDIEKQVNDMYGVEMSDSLISRILDKIAPEISAWQSRTLESIYAIVYMDAMVFKVKDDNGYYRNKSLHFAIGITLEGKKDLLGMWLTNNEGAKFWLSVVTDLKNRGVEDILIASVDGLRGFSEAINSVFPKTIVQRCIIHQIRYSLKYVGSKYQKEFMSDLKRVYKAPTKSAAEDALEDLSAKWGEKYPMVINSWKTNWAELSTYFEYSEPIRRIIYTTNTVEGFNRQIRKITKSKGGFTNDDALFKIVFLVYKDISKKWDKAISNWAEIMSQLSIVFNERIAGHLS
ncbi:IS256 family transposase [Calditerrivibrio nitroreducens]|uniref:Mutator family transposase n=1 Tax=Calditerrivibrio nitroreducens (strain DSM 19672 / NBRC 101217 / Yu37-1) TaxID=768670 RepID=E4TF97_CALNY|nr:IS256 family transposase [Calditerrivibrio nitroreducens]ADR18026.1 transposase mutator type [Calditerrivibrio nitroreducens DSM 19672]ADR18436.1 transposase mutator type [Calditerrivibrio nitroreducens DSM 19672]